MDPKARTALLDRISGYHWYQSVPLGDGFVTPGEDDFTETKLPLLDLPEHLGGRSVLDIGCSEGFFAFEAERRGASKVLGIDKAPGLSEKFALLRDLTGSAVEYRDMEVYDLSAETTGVFDLVIFLSVFQHLRHPYLALDRIAETTGVTAIMEIPVCVTETDDEAFRQCPHTMMRRSASGRRILLPNEAMLTEMLRDAGFVAIDRLTRHRPREVPGYGGRFRQERLILKAHKGTDRL